jgi:mycofactocin biosynthesis protein MftB
VSAPVRPADRLRLSDRVALRPERFGALAYDFDTRRLSFLKHPDLVSVVEALDGARTVAEALDLVGVDPHRRPSFLRALGTLAASGMVVAAGPPVPDPSMSQEPAGARA